MTEENIEDAQIIAEEQKPDAETAFIMVKQEGVWKASTDLSMTLLVERASTRNDIKTGTRDIYKFLSDDDLSNMVAAKIIASNKTDSERATEGVRQALSDRDIL
jgi:hypothetical protein